MKTIKNYLVKAKIDFMEKRNKLHFSIGNYDLVVFCNRKDMYEIVITTNAVRVCTYTVCTQAKVKEILKGLNN